MVAQNNIISQVLNLKSLNAQVFFLEKIFNMFTPGEGRVMNHLIAGTNCWEEFFAGQERIGKSVGLARETVNRLIMRLRELGLVIVVNRPYKSNLYYIHPLFNNSYLRERLRHVFKAFKYLPLCILKSMRRCSDLITNVTNVTVLINNYKNIYLHDDNDINEVSSSKYYARGNLTVIKSSSEKKEKNTEMKESRGTDLIPDYVHSIPIPLSLNGKISFSVFPKGVIEYALRRLSRFQKSDPEERARYLYGICKNYSHEQNVKIRYDWAVTLKKNCNVSMHTPFTNALSSKCDAAVTQPGLPPHRDATHQDTQKGERVGEKTTAKSPFYEKNSSEETYDLIARKNRATIRKCGLNMDNLSSSPQPKEDPVIAYAKMYSWKQSSHYAKARRFSPDINNPFTKPTNISDREGYYKVENWKHSNEGQTWISEKKEQGRIDEFINPYIIKDELTCIS